MRSDKQITNLLVAKATFRKRLISLSVIPRFTEDPTPTLREKKVNDEGRRVIINAKYSAAKEVASLSLDKPVNTIIALMVSNPRRFTYKRRVAVENVIVTYGNNYTLTTTSFTVVDRVSKVNFNYRAEVKEFDTRDCTSPLRSLTTIEGLTKQEHIWVVEAMHTVSALRRKRLAVAKAYLEKRSIRESRNKLLKAYPNGE